MYPENTAENRSAVAFDIGISVQLMAVVELNCGIFLKFWISEFQFCILHLCCSPVGTIIRTFYHSFMFILKFYICVLPYWCILHLFCVCTYLCALYILVSYTFFLYFTYLVLLLQCFLAVFIRIFSYGGFQNIICNILPWTAGIHNLISFVFLGLCCVRIIPIRTLHQGYSRR